MKADKDMQILQQARLNRSKEVITGVISDRSDGLDDDYEQKIVAVEYFDSLHDITPTM